jgi:predicted RNA binding protein YcfA (HicA-like mRNA interferase family)
LCKITELPTKRVLKALHRVGWVVSGGKKHYKLIHPAQPGALTIPRSRNLKKGLIRAIIRQAGLTVERFYELYK